MSDLLTDLYQRVILDHARAPRNFGTLVDASHRGTGDNPMCGDRVTVSLRLDGEGRIDAAAFEGKGCALCIASGSLMTEEVRGRSVGEARRLGRRFAALCSAREAAAEADDADDAAALQRLAVFSGVRAFPSRRRCATLAWEALHDALAGVAADRPDGTPGPG